MLDLRGLAGGRSHLVIAEKRRAERATGIMRGGLDKDFFKQPRPQDLSVKRAIMRDPSGQAKILLLRHLFVVPDDVKRHHLKRLLKGGGDVLMLLGKSLPFSARRERVEPCAH